MKNIIILGAGGHAAEIDEYIQYSEKKSIGNEYSICGFLDDVPDNYLRYDFSAPLLGGISDHQICKECTYIIAIANLNYRRAIVEDFKSKGCRFESFIHPSAYISKTAKIGEGSIIGPSVNLGPNVAIGSFNLLNSRCSLGHDTVVGNYNFISPNVCFSGFSAIGDENLFGINSATIPGIKVGSKNRIAAGMVLDKSVGDNSIIFHRFKEKIFAYPKED